MTRAERLRRRRRRRRIAVAVGLLATAALAVARTAGATFTARVSPTHASDTGVLDLSWPASGRTGEITLAISDLYPGQSRYRVADLQIGGQVDFKTLSLTTGRVTSSSLDTDTANGIQLAIDRCNNGTWTEAGSSPDYTYTCTGGDVKVVLASTPLIGTLSLSNMLLTAGSLSHLRFTLLLPTSSPSSMQGATSRISFTFNGTQRDATSK